MRAFFGIMINEIENPRQELRRKPIHQGTLVQKVCCAPCRGPQYVVPFLDLCMMKFEDG